MTKDFRGFLQEELVRRVARNPRYSLRSYAQALNTDFSTLAKFLRGDRVMGAKTITRLGAELGLTPVEVDAFLDRQRGRSASSKKLDDQYRVLTADLHHIAADWYHDAILEMLRLKTFEGRIPWISKALGLSVTEVRAAVDRLKRAKLLSVDERNRWHDCSGGKTTILGQPALQAAGKARQRQVLQKALAALDETAPDERDQTSVTVAIDKSRLAEARKRIQAFRRELAADLCSSAKLDDVYHLSVSLYPVTKVTRGTKK